MYSLSSRILRIVFYIESIVLFKYKRADETIIRPNFGNRVGYKKIKAIFMRMALVLQRKIILV